MCAGRRKMSLKQVEGSGSLRSTVPRFGLQVSKFTKLEHIMITDIFVIIGRFTLNGRLLWAL